MCRTYILKEYLRNKEAHVCVLSATVGLPRASLQFVIVVFPDHTHYF